MGLEGQINGTWGRWLPQHMPGGGASPGLRLVGPDWKAEGRILGKKGMHSVNSHERVSVLEASIALFTEHLDLCPGLL